MAIEQATLEGLLKSAFPEAEILVKDTVGDQDHYEVSITTSKFNGLSKVMQHKMVFDALGSIVGTTLHAISLKTSPTN